MKLIQSLFVWSGCVLLGMAVVIFAIQGFKYAIERNNQIEAVTIYTVMEP